MSSAYVFVYESAGNHLSKQKTVIGAFFGDRDNVSRETLQLVKQQNYEIGNL
jgi:hypothetical protein